MNDSLPQVPPSGPEAAIRSFFDQWHVYELLVRHDYMSHRGIHSALRKALSASRRTPFSVMDLGCGDGSMIAHTLEGLPVSGYVGIDLSEIALGIARETFAAAAFPVEFVACNLVEYLGRSDTKSADVAIAGFAVHHLDDHEKAKFFRDCRERLKPAGVLFLFDVFRRPGQIREEYLDAYCGQMENDWVKLSEEQKRSISEHIRNYDFPVSYEVLFDLAGRAGFQVPPEPIYTDEGGFHCLCRFEIRD